MNNPNLYHKANDLQRVCVEGLLKEHLQLDLLHWKTENGVSSILDIGCGPGDITYDILLPKMPIDFTKFDAVDISKEMIEYANENFKHPKLKFQQLNIDTYEIDKFIAINGRYDYIFSFYCLHWIPNQLNAMKNIYDLLNENGECLLAFCTDTILFDTMEELANSIKWSEYMTDVKLFTTPYRYLENSPTIELEKIITEIGFSCYKTYIKNIIYTFKDDESLNDCMKSMDPFLDRIPMELKDAYINDLVHNLRSKNKNVNKNYTFTYDMMLAYLQK